MGKYTLTTINCFNELKKNLEKNNIDVIVKKVDNRYNYILEENISLKTLVEIVCDVIQEKVGNSFTTKYLANHYELTSEEKEKIKVIFLESACIKKTEGASYVSHYLLYLPIFEFLEENFYLDIDGWIKFRIQKYKLILGDILEQTIYDYDMNSNYLQWLYFLREIHFSQELREDFIHMIFTANTIELYNEEQEKLDIYERIKEFDEEILLEEDLIMNLLINLSPKTILLHDKNLYKNQSFVITLEEIFENQIGYCFDCSVCFRKDL
ncbi:hypothetical protein AN396_10525 [Candidatus Epulonipiscium fishelsonii]|uniref:Uncharacterized protein n=1 Tax=Candidatus Epulonipiscium fishelsonii TaxID=77094 RepID=A0ACC8X9C9_9FIRM|nr:hypothetical protein AN396_10525 [Epulopiscium sp. SCG-B11WGA-EpuloA1]